MKFDPADVSDLVRCYSFPEVASILGFSVKTLREHVKAGRIRTMTVGTTDIRPRRKIQGYSIQTFIRKQKEQETQPCPSIKAKTLPSTSTTSKSTAVAFTDLQAQKASEKLSVSKVILSGKPGSKPITLKFHENGPLTLDVAAGRYWQEVGQHHSGSGDTWRDLERLIAYFGPGKLLADITDDHVAKLVTWRRAQRVARHRKKPAKKDAPLPPLVSPATVNRSTTGVLKKLFTRAKRAWKRTFPNEPCWKEHWLQEAGERVRELHDHEGDALDKAVRSDYEPWLSFARVTGLRLRETLITWPQVNWQAGQIVTKGKGGKIVTTPITPTVRAILEPLKGHHPESVFTYVAERGRNPRTGAPLVKGQRYPITYAGAKSAWKRMRKVSGITGFRFHDIRHDVGTKLLRATGNLKLVQRALNHSDLKTTTRYAHVLDEEVGAALDLVAKSRSKPATPSPVAESRSDTLKVA